jgi:hypothetical protein
MLLAALPLSVANGLINERIRINLCASGCGISRGSMRNQVSLADPLPLLSLLREHLIRVGALKSHHPSID